ncbi:MAG: 3'-5' exonuclease [Lentimicrobiaceae bacterium]|jgi:DNA polymerase elongation subunit (family B)|nr:3'-5' exonuclease [Lentimicrobiaceae bacterium]
MNVHISRIDITKILFLDIETVPQYATYDEVPEVERELWEQKSKRLRSDDISEEDLYKKAGIFAEFGKIVCISAAYVLQKKDDIQVRVRSFAGHDEKQVLLDFMELIRKHFDGKQTLFCAHNGIEFDFPYLARRALIHGITIPRSLDTRGKKPWETPYIDTLDLWRFGDYKNYTSLKLLAHIFAIPTPKDDIDGSMVCDVYWRENDLQRIVTYCQKDVIAILQLFRRYRCEELIPDDAVVVVE